MTQIKNSQVNIRFSEEEYIQVQQRAKANDMTITAYLRERIFFDAPLTEQNSFEFKVLKVLGFCAGILTALSDEKFNDKEKQELVQTEINKILISIGIDPQKAKKKI